MRTASCDACALAACSHVPPRAGTTAGCIRDGPAPPLCAASAAGVTSPARGALWVAAGGLALAGSGHLWSSGSRGGRTGARPVACAAAAWALICRCCVRPGATCCSCKWVAQSISGRLVYSRGWQCVRPATLTAVGMQQLHHAHRI